MRTIFITGRYTGLGNAAVRLFAANGWKVIATMRNLDNGTELTAVENVTVMPLDVTDATQIKATAAATLAQGPVEMVFNNAGNGLVGR